MSNTASQIGFGIAIATSTTLGGTYTAFAEVLEITPPAYTQEASKVMRSDATAAVTEKIPGWAEYGDAEVTISYVPAQRGVIEGLKNVRQYFKITFPLISPQATSGDTKTWYGFVTKVGDETPLKDAMKCKVSIAVSGPVTSTTGT